MLRKLAIGDGAARRGHHRRARGIGDHDAVGTAAVVAARDLALRRPHQRERARRRGAPRGRGGGGPWRRSRRLGLRLAGTGRAGLTSRRLHPQHLPDLDRVRIRHPVPPHQIADAGALLARNLGQRVAGLHAVVAGLDLGGAAGGQQRQQHDDAGAHP
ncbi:hypothetical protein G6F57_020230 [Rhizopus arrhizus]|nr:hypothetical protein G6F57_020230 [Rhizopus arrhizus]